MASFGTRKDGRRYPKQGRRSASKSDMQRLKDQDRNRTIRALNYSGGDYIGPNPSRRSRQLDRKHRNMNQPWEKRR
jgi:hypothetical protein